MKRKSESFSWFRAGAFLFVCFGLIWFLFRRVSLKLDKSGFIKNKNDSNSGLSLKETVFQSLEECVLTLVPEEAKNNFLKIQETVVGKGSNFIEGNEAIKNASEKIEETFQNLFSQISNFPEKQKKEIKREAIRRVCEELMREDN